MSTDPIIEETPISPDEALGIMRRLRQAFQLADSVLTGEQRGRIWMVVGIEGDPPPAVKSFDTPEELGAEIADLRMRQNDDPENRYYVHIFYGTRWSIQKGRTWKIWDGKSLIPVEGGDLDPYLDDTGSLLERPDLDDMVPTPANAGSGQNEDPASDVESDPTDDEEEDVEVGPYAVGEEPAPPGADPEIT
jgi:hypothetical protein